MHVGPHLSVGRFVLMVCGGGGLGVQSHLAALEGAAWVILWSKLGSQGGMLSGVTTMIALALKVAYRGMS